MSTKKLSFAKRFGYEPIEIPIQINSMSNELRIELWNAYMLHFFMDWEEATGQLYHNYKGFHASIWIHFLKRPLQDFPDQPYEFRDAFHDIFSESPHYRVYETIEYLLMASTRFKMDGAVVYNVAKKFGTYINSKLKEHNAGYRLIDNVFVPISSETEISEIKKASENSTQLGLSNIQEHLKASIALLAQKPNPDYANSIKESISMVEAAVKIIEPTAKTLGDGLNTLERSGKIPIHPALKSGFSSIYGYTSDSKIRHAQKFGEQDNLGDEDARFFLVACSAFTNLLIDKARKQGLLKLS